MICSVCLFSYILTFSCSLLRRRGLQRVCSPIRPDGATLNQAISDQSSVNCRCCIKILLPYLLLSQLTSISLSSFLKLCASTLLPPLYIAPRPPPSFLPFSEIQSLHDTFLELRDVHPISISWLLLVKLFPFVSPHTTASRTSHTYTTPPAVSAAQTFKMTATINLVAQQHPHQRGSNASKATSKLNRLKLMTTMKQRPHTYNNQGGYLPNGATAGHTGLPQGAAPLLPNHGRVIQTGGVRVLCVADVRGVFQSHHHRR